MIKSLSSEFLKAFHFEENQSSDIYLPQRFKVFQSDSQQSLQNFETQDSVSIEEILESNKSIAISSGIRCGKTTLARRIKELIWEQYPKKNIIPLFISAKKSVEFSINSIIKQQQLLLNEKQVEQIEKDIIQGGIKATIIIYNFDHILQENQEFLRNLDCSQLNKKCNFIYIINQFAVQQNIYQKWIEKKNSLLKFEIIKLKKTDIQKYFEKFLPWNGITSEIDLSLSDNEKILKQIGDRVRNTTNIYNIFQLKQQNYRQ